MTPPTTGAGTPAAPRPETKTAAAKAAAKPSAQAGKSDYAGVVLYLVLFVLITGGLVYGTRHLWWRQGEPVLARSLPAGVMAALAPGGNGSAPVLVTAPAEPVPDMTETPEDVLNEQGAETVTGTVAAPVPVEIPAGIAARLRDLEDGFAGLAASVAAMDDRPEAMAVDARIAALSARLTDLEARLADSMPSPAMRRVQALILAIGQLRAASLHEGPFTLALQGVTALAAQDATLAQAVAVLEKHAARGVKSLARLQAGFPAAAGAVARAGLRDHDGDVLGATLDNLRRLVSVRRTDGAEATSVDGLLTEAQRALDENDLARAVAAMNKLEDAALAAASDWLNAAKARLAVDGAVAALNRRAIRLLGGEE